MIPPLFFSELGLVALVWVFLMLYWLWPNDSTVCRQPIAPSTPPRRQRSNQPKPFAGLTQKPYCVLCEHAAAYPHVPPPASPDAIPSPPSGTPGILVANDLNYWFFYAYNGNIFDQKALAGSLSAAEADAGAAKGARQSWKLATPRSRRTTPARVALRTEIAGFSDRMRRKQA